MPDVTAPQRPRRGMPLIDPKTGEFTDYGFTMLDRLWRQVGAGHVIIPCTASGTNLITLTPNLHKEGAAAYGDHMTFAAVAAHTTTGVVTALVGSLATLKVFKTAGAAQATTGDIVINCFYLFCYVAALDGAAGGFVLK